MTAERAMKLLVAIVAGLLILFLTGLLLISGFRSAPAPTTPAPRPPEAADEATSSEPPHWGPRPADAPEPASPAPLPAAEAPRPARAGSVRIVDGRTGEPIDITYGWPAFRLQWPDGRWEPQPKERRRPDAAGRFPVDLPLPADREPAAGDPRILEVALPGWELARIAVAEVRGPVDLPLRPLEIAVAGRVVFPAGEVSSAHVEVFSVDEEGRDGVARAAGRIARDGRFEIRGLPRGRWVLRAAVLSRVPGERWDEEKVLRRTFEQGEGFQDLGDLQPGDPVSVRVRVLDERGDPLGGEEIRIIRVGKPLLDFTLEGTHGWVREGPVGSLMGLRTPEEGEGWLEVGGLDPGEVYRFIGENEKVIEQPVLDDADPAPAAPAPPEVRWEIPDVTFTAPARAGESLDVELHRREPPPEDPPVEPK